MDIENIIAKVVAKYDSDLLYEIIDKYCIKNEAYEVIEINLTALENILDIVKSEYGPYGYIYNESFCEGYDYAEQIRTSTKEERKKICSGLEAFINFCKDEDSNLSLDSHKSSEFKKTVGKGRRSSRKLLGDSHRKDFLNWLQDVRYITMSSARCYLYQLENILENYYLNTGETKKTLLCTKEHIEFIKHIIDEYEQGSLKQYGNSNGRTSLRSYYDFLNYSYRRLVTLEFEPDDESLFIKLLSISHNVIVKYYYKNKNVEVKNWKVDYISPRGSIKNWIYDSYLFKEILSSGDISKIKFSIDISDEKRIAFENQIKLKEKADAGDPETQYEFACKLYDAESYENAFNYFSLSADKGNSEAQKKLGDMYVYGQGVPKNNIKALEWYEKSAMQGNTEVLGLIGNLWFEGIDGKIDFSVALDYYLKASEKDDAFSQYRVGYIYYNGLDTPEDHSKAFHWYTKAANNGDISGRYCLAKMYYYGEGTEQSYEKAFKWFKEAAEQGHSDSQYYLGWMYYYGQDTEIKYDEARIWFEKSAVQGNKNAQYTLGEIYYFGQGTDICYEKAFELYIKSAKQGHPYAQYRLGWMYHHGLWIPQNYSEAESWYKKSSEQGNKYAQNELGNIYYRAEKYEAAKKFYEQSAQQDFSLARFSLGKMYFCGQGVNKSTSKAKSLWAKAAEQDNVYAIYCLSCMYRDGIGVEINEKKAREFFEKAKDRLTLDDIHELEDLFKLN